MALVAVALFGTCLSFGLGSIEVRQPVDIQEPCGVTVVSDVAAEPNLVSGEQSALSRKSADTNSPGSEPKSADQEIAAKACALIEQGKFDDAGQLTGSSGYEQQEPVSQLKDIVVRWQNMQKKRQSQREVAYKEELAKFERIRTGKRSDGNEVNDANDSNEPNGPVAVLATVTRTIEFADEKQKQSLLSDPCLLDAVARAKAEAAGLEQKGKWLDAYIMCYSWLAALEPNNKVYTDYAERIIDKAEIAGGFQDSPCEIAKQRFEGVKRRIFERAIDALNLNYVSSIDYQAMAAKGIRQCRSLAEVVGTLIQKGTGAQEQKSTSEPNASVLGDSFKDFTPDANAIAKFCSELTTLEKETADWPQGAGKDKFIAVFEKVLELNLTTARLPEGVVISQFTEASFLALDPYTVLVWPRDIPEFEQQMTNEFTGIGIEISRQQGRLTVSSLLLDTPAFNSELDVGDVIEKVNGVATKDLPITCAVEKIKGPAGTKVILTIRRGQQEQTRDITLTRAKIVVPTVRGWQRTDGGKWLYMMDEQEKIGYVRLTGFSEKTASDMEEALKLLEASGMRGLILDLRINPGGIFESAIEVSDAFLDDGLIVITRPRFGIPSYAAARRKGTHPNYPMVVLIGPGSASASEIVAGALADPSHKRATLVGERTHGKGVVQGITHYPGEGAELKYTMANWYLPSGQKIKSQEEAKKENTKWGIGPDVAVELRSDEFRRMLEVQRDNDVFVRAGRDNSGTPLKRHTIEQTAEADPQLATGILVLKSKLICGQARTAKSQIPISKS